MRSTRHRFTLTAAILLITTSAAVAADLPAKQPPLAQPVAPIDAWRFTVMPYFWAPSLNGTSTIRGRTADVDATFIDLAEHAQIPKDLFGAMAYLEASKGSWSFFTDLVYLKLVVSRSGFRETNVAPGISGSIAASADLSIKMFIGEAAAAYEVARFGAPASYSAFDVYAGARGWWQEGDARLDITAQLDVGDLEISGNRAIAKSGNVTWLDPFIGLRWRHQFAPDKELIVRGDVGGFGVGSDNTWQAVATFDWEFSRTPSAVWKAVIGYRALHVDFSKGAGRTLYEFDMLVHGPIFGVSASF